MIPGVPAPALGWLAGLGLARGDIKLLLGVPALPVAPAHVIPGMEGGNIPEKLAGAEPPR